MVVYITVTLSLKIHDLDYKVQCLIYVVKFTPILTPPPPPVLTQVPIGSVSLKTKNLEKMLLFYHFLSFFL